MRRLLLLCVLLAACESDEQAYRRRAIEAHDRQNDALLGPVWDVLSRPDRIELLTLTPDDDGCADGFHEYDRRVSFDRFHGYPVLGRAEIDERTEQEELVSAFYRGSREGNWEALCFRPHHALRAERDHRVVDLVLCFECLHYQLYDGDEERPQTTLSPVARAAFVGAAIRHGLPVEYDEPERRVTMGQLRMLREYELQQQHERPPVAP